MSPEPAEPFAPTPTLPNRPAADPKASGAVPPLPSPHTVDPVHMCPRCHASCGCAQGAFGPDPADPNKEVVVCAHACVGGPRG